MKCFRFILHCSFAAAVFAFALSRGASSLSAKEPTDPFRAGSIWKGEVLYHKNDYNLHPKPMEMILYVKQRRKTKFNCVAWYPSDENRLITVIAAIDKLGNILFSEQKVLHDDGLLRKEPTVGPHRQFTGRRINSTIKGQGEWTGPAFNGPIRFDFSLTLVE